MKPYLSKRMIEMQPDDEVNSGSPLRTAADKVPNIFAVTGEPNVMSNDALCKGNLAKEA